MLKYFKGKIQWLMWGDSATLIILASTLVETYFPNKFNVSKNAFILKALYPSVSIFHFNHKL